MLTWTQIAVFILVFLLILGAPIAIIVWIIYGMFFKEEESR